MRTNELMLYKNMEHGRILKNMTFLMENCGNDYYNREDLRSLLFECMIYHYTVGEFFTNIDSEPALPVMDQSFEFRCTVILCNQWNNLLSRHYSIVPILNIHYYLELEHPILNQKGNRFLCLLHSYHCF